MTQPLDLITGALKDIGACASGEVPDVNDVQDMFILLNLMLDQWSNEHMMVYCLQEVIQELVGGKYIYTIGPNGNVGAGFTGNIANNLLTVTGMSAGALSVGQIIQGPNVTANSSITSLGTGLGGTGIGAIGTYNLSQSSTSSGPFTSYAPRPIRINNAFVRVVNSITGVLDYPVSVIPEEQYSQISIKTLPGPWPRCVYYQPSEPVGVLNYWPNPSQGEMHLFCDTLLGKFNTINDTIILPQGYEMAIRANLAMEALPMFGKLSNQAIVEGIVGRAKGGKALIKRTNMRPIEPARFDDVPSARRGRDAGWILHGGFLNV